MKKPSKSPAKAAAKPKTPAKAAAVGLKSLDEVQPMAALLASAEPGKALPAWNGLHVYAVDIANGKVLADAGADTARDPASLTKLMTGYLVQEALAKNTLRMDDRFVVHAPYAKRFVVGQSYTVRELMDAMLVRSDNAASETLGNALGNDVVTRMNETAKAMGLSQTHFVNTHGYPVPGKVVNTTTATDIAKLILRFHRDYPQALFEHAAKPSATFAGHEHEATNWLNKKDSPLALPEPYRIAAKTGYTDRAGHNIAGLVEGPGGRKMIVVVLGGYSVTPADAKKLSVPEPVIEESVAKSRHADRVAHVKGNRVVNAVVQDLVTELMPRVTPQQNMVLKPIQHREIISPAPATRTEPKPAPANKNTAIRPEDMPIVFTVPLPKRSDDPPAVAPVPAIPSPPATASNKPGLRPEDAPIVFTVPLPKRSDTPPAAVNVSSRISSGKVQLRVEAPQQAFGAPDNGKPLPPEVPRSIVDEPPVAAAPAKEPAPTLAKPREFVTHSIAGLSKEDLKAVDACKKQLKATGVVPSRPGPESTATVKLQEKPTGYQHLQQQQLEANAALKSAQANLGAAQVQWKAEKTPKKRKAIEKNMAALRGGIKHAQERIQHIGQELQEYASLIGLENQGSESLYTQKNYDAVIARSKEYIDGFVDHWDGKLPSTGREGLRQMMYAIAEGSAGMETGWNPTIVKGSANRGTYTGVYQTGWPFIADAAKAIERNPGMMQVLAKYPEDKKVLDFARANHTSLKGQPTTSFTGQAASFTAMMVASYRRVTADEKADLDKFSGANTYKEHMLGGGGAAKLAKQLRENPDKKGSPGMSEEVYNANFMMADKPFAQLNDLNPKRIMYQDVTARDVDEMLRSKFIHARNKLASGLKKREMPQAEAEKHITAFERAFLPEWTNNPTQRANDIARMEHQKQIGFEWRQTADVTVPDKTAICHILKPMPPVGKPRL